MRRPLHRFFHLSSLFLLTAGLFTASAYGNYNNPAYDALINSGDCSHGDDYFACVNFIQNYDGDTLTFDIHDVHPLLGGKISVRVKGVDTPEMRSADGCEVEVAKKAQAAVAKLMSRSHRVDLMSAIRGKYFRVVADVVYDGKSLAQFLLRNKYAVPYEGGSKDSIDWCNFR